MYTYQRTINKEISFNGVGLHTGEFSNVKLKPAKEQTGVVFVRVDKETNNLIKANYKNVVDTQRGTTISNGKYEVYTIEHILSALYALGIDNLIIEIDNVEPPILDGSSKEFVEKILEAGIEKLSTKRETIIIKEPIFYFDPENKIEMSILPSEDFKVSFTADYNYGKIGEQSYELESMNNFVEEIASARTFCSFNELYFLKKNGLIKGGGLDNAIVFLDEEIDESNIKEVKNIFNLDLKKIKTDSRTLNDKRLRYDNEPVRHKILDLLGDFSLFGAQIQGHIHSKRGGHNSNINFLKKIKMQLNSKDIKYTFNKKEIQQVIPHRDPFLLIDEIVDIDPGKKVIAVKKVDSNDYFLEGHFPGNPIMPGVIIVECMAQASCFLSLNLVEDRENKMMLLSNVKNAKFVKKVLINDIINIEVTLIKFRLNTALFSGIAKVNGDIVAKAEFLATVVNKNE